ncbi:hypothetical protein [Yoonia sp. R2-816]|uniref:hypothetical protein n=1 Tax=Yoonia sp. R2-816 TaxID=3342638 RepID=UPI00372B55B6
MNDTQDPPGDLPAATDPHRCPFCIKPISEGAKRCPSCGTYQGWRHMVNMFLPAAATALTIAVAWQPLWGAYKTFIGIADPSDVRIIDVFFDGTELKTEIVNFNELPALLYGTLRCQEEWSSEHSLELSLYPASYNEGEFGSRLFVAGSRLESTLVTWGVWNASVEDAPRTEMDGARNTEVRDQLLTHLSGIDEFSSSRDLEELADEAVRHIGQGAWLPMSSSFNYHASLSARLLEKNVRGPQEEYSFVCRLNGVDDSGDFETNAFEVTFGVGSHGFNDLNPFEP